MAKYFSRGSDRHCSFYGLPLPFHSSCSRPCLGDAVLIKFQNPDYGLSPEQIADIRAAYAADGTIFSQYLHAIGNFLTGNFGYSLQAGVAVRDQIATNLPPTLWLAGLGLLGAILLSVLIAILANLPPLRWLRSLAHSIPSLFISVPTFWLGIMLIQIFSFRFRLGPVINPGPWQGLILPVLTVAVPLSAPLAQILLRNIDEVLTRPFVPVARAKGLHHVWVLWRHVAKNALLPRDDRGRPPLRRVDCRSGHHGNRIWS